MKIEREGREYVLSKEEMEKAFREREDEYLREDAKRHLKVFVDNLFSKAYGFELFPVLEGADEGFLDALSEGFKEAQDCNVPENDIWEEVVTERMNRLRKNGN